MPTRVSESARPTHPARPEIEERGSPAAIQRWMLEKIADTLGVPCASLDPTQPFGSYGLDSIAGFILASDLADWLQRDIPATLVWDFPTIADLSRNLGEAADASGEPR